MNNKHTKTIITCLVVFSMLGLANFALADSHTPDQPIVPAISLPEKAKTEATPATLKTEKQLVKILRQGQRLINERLKALNGLNKQINKSNLTTDQKNNLSGLTNQQIKDLTALGNKIKVDTDINTVKAEVKSIYESYRIFAVYIPKTRLMMSIYTQQNHLNKLDDYFSKIQTKINQAKAKGKDVAVRQKALDDAKSMVPNVKVKIDSTLNALSALKPADYSVASKRIISDTNKNLKEIHAMFVKLNQTLGGAK